jgi:hypothetical protein
MEARRHDGRNISIDAVIQYHNTKKTGSAAVSAFFLGCMKGKRPLLRISVPVPLLFVLERGRNRHKQMKIKFCSDFPFLKERGNLMSQI